MDSDLMNVLCVGGIILAFVIAGVIANYLDKRDADIKGAERRDICVDFAQAFFEEELEKFYLSRDSRARWDQYGNLIVNKSARYISDTYKITEATKRIKLQWEDERTLIGYFAYYMSGIVNEVPTPTSDFLSRCAVTYKKAFNDWDVYECATLDNKKMNMSAFLVCLHDKLRASICK